MWKKSGCSFLGIRVLGGVKGLTDSFVSPELDVIVKQVCQTPHSTHGRCDGRISGASSGMRSEAFCGGYDEAFEVRVQ
jgi:hypothetical protein